jgi:DNA-binding NarL/FixJ family response regulator
MLALMGTGKPTGEESETRVAITDCCPAYRRGLSDVLAEQGLTIEEPEDLAAWVAEEGPRAVIATVACERDAERLSGLASASSQLITVALLTEVSARAYSAALRRGAHAVVGHDAPLDEIVEVLRFSFKGRIVMPIAIARSLAIDGEATAETPITRTEATWIRSLAHGETVSSVARQAGYSDRAMHRHLHDLYRRLGAKTRAQAIVRAARLGLLERDAATDGACDWGVTAASSPTA